MILRGSGTGASSVALAGSWRTEPRASASHARRCASGLEARISRTLAGAPGSAPLTSMYSPRPSRGGGGGGGAGGGPPRAARGGAGAALVAVVLPPPPLPARPRAALRLDSQPARVEPPLLTFSDARPRRPYRLPR